MSAHDLSKWPTEYVIKSRRWTIEYLPKEHPDLVDEDSPLPSAWLMGFCEPRTSRIAVCSDMSLEAIRDTLAHELCHAYYSTMPGVDHDSETAESDEENWVLSATECFFEIVRNSESLWWVYGL